MFIRYIRSILCSVIGSQEKIGVTLIGKQNHHTREAIAIVCSSLDETERRDL
jgi:hypothetical protein